MLSLSDICEEEEEEEEEEEDDDNDDDDDEGDNTKGDPTKFKHIIPDSALSLSLPLAQNRGEITRLIIRPEEKIFNPSDTCAAADVRLLQSHSAHQGSNSNSNSSGNSNNTGGVSVNHTRPALGELYSNSNGVKVKTASRKHRTDITSNRISNKNNNKAVEVGCSHDDEQGVLKPGVVNRYHKKGQSNRYRQHHHSHHHLKPEPSSSFPSLSSETVDHPQISTTTTTKPGLHSSSSLSSSSSTPPSSSSSSSSSCSNRVNNHNFGCDVTTTILLPPSMIEERRDNVLEDSTTTTDKMASCPTDIVVGNGHVVHVASSSQQGRQQQPECVVDTATECKGGTHWTGRPGDSMKSNNCISGVSVSESPSSASSPSDSLSQSSSSCLSSNQNSKQDGDVISPNYTNNNDDKYHTLIPIHEVKQGLTRKQIIQLSAMSGMGFVLVTIIIMWILSPVWL